jgi:hypothetical protein
MSDTEEGAATAPGRHENEGREEEGSASACNHEQQKNKSLLKIKNEIRQHRAPAMTRRQRCGPTDDVAWWVRVPL